MSNTDYKQIIEDLSVEMFGIHTSMLAASEENEKLVLKVKMLETRNEELELACVNVLDLKQKIEYHGKIRKNTIRKLNMHLELSYLK